MANPGLDLTLRSVALSNRVTSPPPARTLDDAVRLCDPFTPLDPDGDSALRGTLDDVRGGDRLAKIARNIRRSGGISTLHFLSGHLGGGKTTELLRMARTLEKGASGVPSDTVLFLNADTMLDRHDVDLEDILVALWAIVFSAKPEAAASVLGPLWKNDVRERLLSLVVNLPDAVPAALDEVLKSLRIPSFEERKKLRLGLGSVASILIGGLNRALNQIREDQAGNVVVLIDNLEKLSLGQREGVERLYLERMGALKDLDAHLVITVPLYLCYAASGASLIGLYGGEIVVLPMIKVRERVAAGGGDDAAGLGALADLLCRRVDFDRLFEGGRRAAEDIARLSGGCIRHALRIVQSAVNEHDVPPVSASSIERAAASLQADFERALPEAWVPILHDIASHNRFPETCTEETKRELLRHLYVLEYQNGDPDPWYAVHPLVERCRKFREVERP